MSNRKLDPAFSELAAFSSPQFDNVADYPAAWRENIVGVIPAARGSNVAVEVVNASVAQPYPENPVPIRIYRPVSATCLLPAMLYFHGGGFVVGNLDTDDKRLIKYSEAVGCVIVSVDYRLAPEHTYPAGISDCYAVLSWLAETGGQEWGIDLTRLAVGGQSSGGCFAAAISLMARDRAGPSLCFQLLINPALDNSCASWSVKNVDDMPVTTPSDVRAMWQLYLGTQNWDGPDVPAYASPARALHLGDLPPTYLVVGALDIFYDENITFAQRLLHAGNALEFHVYPGAPHGFDNVESAQIAQRALAEQIQALKTAFSS